MIPELRGFHIAASFLVHPPADRGLSPRKTTIKRAFILITSLLKRPQSMGMGSDKNFLLKVRGAVQNMPSNSLRCLQNVSAALSTSKV